MKPFTDFEVDLIVNRKEEKPDWTIWKGLLIAVFTAFSIALLCIYFFAPVLAQAFSDSVDFNTGYSTILILLLVTCAVVGWVIIRSGR